MLESWRRMDQDNISSDNDVHDLLPFTEETMSTLKCVVMRVKCASRVGNKKSRLLKIDEENYWFTRRFTHRCFGYTIIFRQPCILHAIRCIILWYDVFDFRGIMLLQREIQRSSSRRTEN